MDSPAGEDSPESQPQPKAKAGSSSSSRGQKHASGRAQPSASRISAACRGCRLKKQKCSGGRPECVQCKRAMQECHWPEQQKRGPPKQYIRALEARLLETEEALLKVLPAIPIQQLEDLFSGEENGPKDQASSTRKGKSLPPEQQRRFGSEYWNAFPLKSAEEVQRWHLDQSETLPSEDTEQSIGFSHDVEEDSQDRPQTESNISSNRFTTGLPDATRLLHPSETTHISQKPSHFENHIPIHVHDTASNFSERRMRVFEMHGTDFGPSEQIQVHDANWRNVSEPVTSNSSHREPLWTATDEEAEYLW